MYIMRCEFCQKENITSGHYGRCEPRQKYFSELLTFDYLTDKYIEQEMSAKEISDLVGMSVNTIIRKLQKFGINTRTIKQSQTNRKEQKRRKTSLDNYGYEHNFCKEHPSRKKWEKRLLDEEGITNVFQRESVKKKALKTLMKNYGVESPSQLQMSRGKNVVSSVHKLVVRLLQEMSCDIGIEYKMPDKKDNNHYYSYDIIITGTKKLIEVYGDYWHGNPKLYFPSDLILKGSSKEKSVEERWSLDYKKIEFAVKRKYKVLIIWEYDIKNNVEKIKNILQEYIK